VSSDDLADFWIHQVIVQTYLGVTGRGEKKYADPVPVDGFLSRRRRYVRGASGDQVTSESSFSADVVHDATLAPESLVTFDANGDPFGAGTFGADDFGGLGNDDGVTTTIISRATSLSGALDLPDRVKVFLQ
jgi:hypothetical protein